MLISNTFLMQEKRVKPNNVFNLYKHNLYRYVVSSFWHIYGCPMRGVSVCLWHCHATTTCRQRHSRRHFEDLCFVSGCFAECIVAYFSGTAILTEGAACSSLSAKTASTVAIIYGGDTKP